MTVIREPIPASTRDSAVQISGLDGTFIGEILDVSQIKQVIAAADKQGTTPRAAIREAINAWLGVA